MSTTVGQRIKRLRESLGLTQQQVADEAGVTRSSVSQWENDNITTILGPNLAACARALRTTSDYLLTGKGEGTLEDPGRYDVSTVPDLLAAAWPNLTQAQRESLARQAAELAEANAAIIEELTRQR